MDYLDVRQYATDKGQSLFKISVSNEAKERCVIPLFDEILPVFQESFVKLG